MRISKWIITGVVILLCLVGSALCFIAYNGRINTQVTKKEFNEKDFNLNILKRTNAKEDSNYMISPYSIYVALSMVRDGADGNTYNQIANIIGSEKKDTLNNEYVHVANAMFLRDQYTDAVRVDYTDRLKNNYKAELLLDKFDTPAVINNWVKTNTKDMIEKILDDIDKDFVLGLANAIAIDVKWQDQFMCSLTTSEEFTRKNGTTINAEMMHQTYSSGTKYIKSDRATGVIIPYQEDTNLEYIGILPNGDLNDYIENLSIEELNKLDESARETNSGFEVSVSLPRYKYDYTYEGFKSTLKDMGMKDAFNDEEADFTRIMTRDNMKKYVVNNLYIDQAIHKTYIELSESGTKAAAATFFGFEKATAIPSQPERVEVKFNKAFMYIIRDKNTKEMLFVGVVDKPNEWKGSTCPNEE